MILIITNKEDYTADYLILELQRRGVKYWRFNTEDFPNEIQIDIGINDNLSSGKFFSPKGEFYFSSISSIWYRRPKKPAISRNVTKKSQEFISVESKEYLNGIWEILLPKFWVSHPNNIYRAENKIFQLNFAHRLGFVIPPTIISNNSIITEAFLNAHKKAIFKPLGYSRFIENHEEKLIFTNPISNKHKKDIDLINICPSLIQKQITKVFDVRVTIIGRAVFAVKIISKGHFIDWRKENDSNIRYEKYKLPRKLEVLCLQMTDMLGLQFNTLDFVISEDGEHYFLEINPNGQWAWLQQFCPDLPLRESLAELLSI